MFHANRNLGIAGKKSRKSTSRGGAHLNNEGNSNITSKRLTIPSGFLCLGFKSETIRKASDKQTNKKNYNDIILNEDLSGLLYQNSSKEVQKLRRSARLLRGSDNNEITRGLTQHNTLDFQENPKCIPNRSKSLFDEINKRCAKVGVVCEANSTLNLTPTKPGLPFADSGAVTNAVNSSFCAELSQQVTVKFKRNSLTCCTSRIFKEIERINGILSGKLIELGDMASNDVELMKPDEVEESVEKFEYIPPFEWVYRTPPKQRIVVAKLADRTIQPAVICTDNKKHSSIYEVNAHLDVDFTKCNSGQAVNLDAKYFKCVANFGHLPHLSQQQQMEMTNDKENIPIVGNCMTRKMCWGSVPEETNDSPVRTEVYEPIINIPDKLMKRQPSCISSNRILRKTKLFENVSEDDENDEGDCSRYKRFQSNLRCCLDDQLDSDLNQNNSVQFFKTKRNIFDDAEAPCAETNGRRLFRFDFSKMNDL